MMTRVKPEDYGYENLYNPDRKKGVSELLALQYARKLEDELEIARNVVTGPAQEHDPLLSDFGKALEEHRESLPVAIMEHFDKLQKQVDFSRGGKFAPAVAPWRTDLENAPKIGAVLFYDGEYGVPVVGFWDYDQERFSCSITGEKLNPPTHWQPITEPKEGK